MKFIIQLIFMILINSHIIAQDVSTATKPEIPENCSEVSLSDLKEVLQNIKSQEYLVIEIGAEHIKGEAFGLCKLLNMDYYTHKFTFSKEHSLKDNKWYKQLGLVTWSKPTYHKIIKSIISNTIYYGRIEKNGLNGDLIYRTDGKYYYSFYENGDYEEAPWFQNYALFINEKKPILK